MDNIQGFKDVKRGGILFPFELTSVPFIPKRIFWIKDVPAGSIRGGHAHKNCQQIYICIKGRIEVEIIGDYNSDKGDRVEVLGEGTILFIDKLIWTMEQFDTEKAILLVLCSHPYDKDDYIYDVKELKEYVKNG